MIGTSPKLREQLACARQFRIPLSSFLSWPDDDQDKALAYERYLAGVCSGCGTHRDDWKADRQAYVAEIGSCIGCETVDQGRKQIEANVPEDQRHSGIFVQLIPRAEAELMDREG